MVVGCKTQLQSRDAEAKCITGMECVLVLVHNRADVETDKQLAGCMQRFSLAAACKLIVYLCVSCMVGKRTASVDTFVTMTDPNRSDIYIECFLHHFLTALLLYRDCLWRRNAREQQPLHRFDHLLVATLWHSCEQTRPLYTDKSVLQDVLHELSYWNITQSCFRHKRCMPRYVSLIDGTHPVKLFQSTFRAVPCRDAVYMQSVMLVCPHLLIGSHTYVCM